MIAKLQEACSLQPLPKPSVSSNSNPPSAEAAPSLLQAPMIRLPPRTSARGIPLWGKGSDGSPCSKPSWELSGTPHCRIKPRDLPGKEGSLSSSSPITSPYPAMPVPSWTLDSGPSPRWHPCQPARHFRASAQNSNVTLSKSRLCLSECPVLPPCYPLSRLISLLSIQHLTSRVYLLFCLLPAKPYVPWEQESGVQRQVLST